MYLYIDETEDENHFVVGGILVKEELTLVGIHKKIRRIIKRQKYSTKTKSILLTELKDYHLNRSHRKLKKTILNELDDYGLCYYSLHIKKRHFKQVDKERVYIKLLKKIVSNIETDLHVVYDEFGLRRFHNNIEVELMKLDNVLSIRNANSQSNKSLQFADIICGTVRRYHQDQDTEMYNLIEDKVIDIL